MEAIRIKLPSSLGTLHAPPCAGGKFYALEVAHDLPTYGAKVGHVDLHAFHKAGGKIYLQNFYEPGTWEEVTPAQIKEKGFRVKFEDDYDSCTTYSCFIPYPPELFLVPQNFRTRRMINRRRRKGNG